MNKKIFFIFLGILLLSSVSAADVAYVVKYSDHPDSSFVDVLNELGYSYDLIDDSKVSETDFSSYSMILIGDESIRDVPVNSYKSLIANPDYYDDWSYRISSTNRNNAYNSDIEILITQGVAREFDPYTPCYTGICPKINYLSGQKYGVHRVTATGVGVADAGNYVIATKQNPRRVFFGITESDYWTGESRELFKNSINWIIEGEDRDGDGFYIDVDCDDGNPDIHPDAEEIPYDGIDQDCDGEDLTDVDIDGYDYLEDCDDNNPDVNPGSEDVFLNCRNDAPIIFGVIDPININETEEILIEVDAADPEGDTLSYSIDDDRFLQEGNVFRWQTDFGDYGTYVFNINVSDYEFASSIQVEAEVEYKNRPPVCENIPDLIWDEDDEVSLNLSDYCHDPDSSYLDFSVYNTSENTKISLELEDGIAVFSTETDWSGDDWIVFKAKDLKDYVLTNEIGLRVSEVNDEPVLASDIENITWSEDTNLTDELDLNDYFEDVDSDLTFNVSETSFIEIIINSGLVSFYPQRDWFGLESIIFMATDGEFIKYSNSVLLEILDVNEVPEFEDLDCEREILEDVDYTCELNASDFENDDFSFSVLSENELECEVNENQLTYVSYKDYVGEASCAIRVNDNEGYNDYLFSVNVLNTNDAPVIDAYSPEDDVKVMESSSQEFGVSASDIDSEFTISWLIDEEINDTGEDFLFQEDEKGDYNITAVVSDGEFEVSKSWNVFVGDISDFTCSEVGGYICSEEEICRGDLLGVSDSISCCSMSCSEKPPEFKDIKKRYEINSDIELEIKKPANSDSFELGDIIDAKVDLRNKANETLDFDVEVYFYDISDDNVIEKEKKSADVGEDRSKTFSFEFEIPEDLDDGNEYAIFVKAIGDNEEEYYNEEFVEIDIERKEHKVIIREVEVGNSDLMCGDFIDIRIRTKNMGASGEDVKIIIENSRLDIGEEGEEFELEEYGGDDSAVNLFNIKIPEDANAGKYDLEITASFDGDEASFEKEITLGECREQEMEVKNIETIKLTKIEKAEEINSNSWIMSIVFVISLTLLVILSVVIYLMISVYKKS